MSNFRIKKNYEKIYLELLETLIFYVQKMIKNIF